MCANARNISLHDQRQRLSSNAEPLTLQVLLGTPNLQSPTKLSGCSYSGPRTRTQKTPTHRSVLAAAQLSSDNNRPECAREQCAPTPYAVFQSFVGRPIRQLARIAQICRRLHSACCCWCWSPWRRTQPPAQPRPSAAATHRRTPPATVRRASLAPATRRAPPARRCAARRAPPIGGAPRPIDATAPRASCRYPSARCAGWSVRRSAARTRCACDRRPAAKRPAAG